EYQLGTLPLWATAPFIAVFGMTDRVVRLASAVEELLALLVLVAFVRRIGWRYGEIGILVFGVSPIFIHMSRVNLSHPPSMLAVSLGFYCFARALDEPGWKWPSLAGIAFGISVYGNAAFYFATPIMIGALGVGSIVVFRRKWAGYLPFLKMLPWS